MRRQPNHCASSLDRFLNNCPLLHADPATLRSGQHLPRVDAATPGRVCATLAMLNFSSGTTRHVECLCDVAVPTSGQCTSGQCESHVLAHTVACTAKDIDCDDPTAGTRSVAASSSSTTASNCTASATTGGSVGSVMYDAENDKALDVVSAHVDWLGFLRDAENDAERDRVPTWTRTTCGWGLCERRCGRLPLLRHGERRGLGRGTRRPVRVRDGPT